jgi:hypothetical protein
VRHLSRLPELSQDGQLALFVAERRLEGFDPHDVALAAVAAGLDGGRTFFEDVLAQAEAFPDVPVPQRAGRDWSEATAHLRRGDFVAASEAVKGGRIPGANACVSAERLKLRGRELPAWDGSCVDHLVSVQHAGIGDALLAARYIPELRSRVRRLSVICHKGLVRLVRHLGGISVVPFAECASVLREADAFVPGLPLPHISDYGRADWLADYPAPPHPLPATALPRVGISWSGRRSNAHNSLRIPPVDALEPLLSLLGVQWHSLMADGTEHPRVQRHELPDFDTTIGIMRALDGIVTADNVVANLAGALGLPVMVLLEYDNDARWGDAELHGNRSPWYPSASVFRRRADEPSWGSVVERVRAGLRKL